MLNFNSQPGQSSVPEQKQKEIEKLLAERENLKNQANQAANSFTNKLSDRIMELRFDDGNYGPLTLDNLKKVNLKALNANGSSLNIPPNVDQAKFLAEGLRNGTIILKDSNNAKVNIQNHPAIKDRLFSENDMSAKADYENTMNMLQLRDKEIQVRLKELEGNFSGLQPKVVYPEIKALQDSLNKLSFEREKLAKQAAIAANELASKLHNNTKKDDMAAQAKYDATMAQIEAQDRKAEMEQKLLEVRIHFLANKINVLDSIKDPQLKKQAESLFKLREDLVRQSEIAANQLNDKLNNQDRKDDAAAMGAYQAKMAQIEAQDKKLKIELKKIEVESQYQDYKKNLLASINDPQLKKQAESLFRMREDLARQGEIAANQLNDKLSGKDTRDDAIAMGKYEEKMAQIKVQDFKLEIELKKLEVESQNKDYKKNFLDSIKDPLLKKQAESLFRMRDNLAKQAEIAANQLNDKMNNKDRKDDAAAMGEYQAKMAQIEAQDKKLEIELKKVEVESQNKDYEKNLLASIKDPRLKRQAESLFKQRESLVAQAEIAANKYSYKISDNDPRNDASSAAEYNKTLASLDNKIRGIDIQLKQIEIISKRYQR